MELLVYLGKEPRTIGDDQELIRKLGKSGAGIPRPMNGLLGKGYKLFVDNWYTSEALFTYLHEKQTAASGTARKNRLSPPPSLKKPQLQKGEHAFRRKGDMLAVRFNDKKEIYFLSTMHQANIVETGERDRHGNNVQRLQVVND